MSNTVEDSGKQQSQEKREEEEYYSFLMPFRCQIAGHGSSEADGHRSFLKHADGRLLKPLQPPPKGTREVGFYEKVNASDDPTDLEIRKCLPKFFGVETFSVSKGEPAAEYIVLEDLTEGRELPNVMDIKIGSQTYGPDASEKKRRHEDAKYAGTKMPLGFSVLGIIVHQNSSDGDGVSKEPKKYDREFGRTLKTEDVADAGRIYFDLAAFPTAGNRTLRPLVEAVIFRLRGLLDVYKRQRNYLTYASSVLFVYDAAAVAGYLKSGDPKPMVDSVNVRLIDFAHVFPNDQRVEDANFTRGLENLIKVFEAVLGETAEEREPSPKK